MPNKLRLRYVIGKGPDDARSLFGANQGRRHFDTPEAAESYLAAVKGNNSLDTLRSVIGPGGAESLAVEPAWCWHHGDAVGTRWTGRGGLASEETRRLYER